MKSYHSNVDSREKSEPSVIFNYGRFRSVPYDTEFTWNPKASNLGITKRKPIILKRTRCSWPAASESNGSKNLRDTCRGSAGTAESLQKQKFSTDGELNSRRDSFLYRSDSLKSKYYSRIVSAKSSISFVELQSDESEVVITPFAQILLTLRSVKDKFIQIFNQKKKQMASLTSEKDFKDPDLAEDSILVDIPAATDTLYNLEWCLSQLENIQTHQSVSELASSKFKRLLSKELIQQNSQRSNKNVSDYICQTFMEETSDICDENKDVNCCRWTCGENEYDSDFSDLQNSIEQSYSWINDWGPDIFTIESQNVGCVLQITTMAILQERKILTSLQLDKLIVSSYLNAVESHYKATISYHTNVHAADVVQSVHVILSMTAFKDVFSDLEIFTTLIAAAIHDVDHPGVTNQFLINTNDQLAILYNDISVLENHHLAVGFTLMTKEGCNILDSFTRSQQQLIRKMTIDMVLATDMSKHMTMLADLKTMVETKQVSGSTVLNLDNYRDRIQILQNLLHCADLSNPTKSLPLYVKWTDRVMTEFFAQGDKERQLEMEISPMCDRSTASVAKSQVSFIDFIVYPLWEAWAELVQPEANLMLDNLYHNRSHYEQLSLKREINSDEE